MDSSDIDVIDADLASSQEEPPPNKRPRLDDATQPDGRLLLSTGDGRTVALTHEQSSIVSLAQPPNETRSFIVRVTSGAGTRKTSTLQALARRLQALGHVGVTYVTFNKSAAADAAQRMGSAVTTRTTHSCAWELMGAGAETPIEAGDVDRKIVAVMGVSVDTFLGGMPGGTPKDMAAKRRARRQVVFFIRRTLETFLMSAHNEEAGLSKWHTYYPAKKWHEGRGLPPGVPSDYGDFYVDATRQWWGKTKLGAGCRPAFITYDSVMKQAQLERKQIRCTALLVDEAQDLNMCQVQWLASQKHCQTFFVGDAVQTIYSFRGAKSKFLMELRVDFDRKLTGSFRFGPRIGAVANTLLFAKEHSRQCDWFPYTVSVHAPRSLDTSHSAPLLGELMLHASAEGA